MTGADAIRERKKIFSLSPFFPSCWFSDYSKKGEKSSLFFSHQVRRLGIGIDRANAFSREKKEQTEKAEYLIFELLIRLDMYKLSWRSFHLI